MDLIYLKPVFQEKIWGGDQLKRQFDMDLPSNQVGEAWVISGHPHGVTKIQGQGTIDGLGLDEFYQKDDEFFGPVKASKFPLLIKILDAHQDLSVQVHPNDEYAQEHERPGELGKTECWYIIDAEEGAEIVFGHSALSREDFIQKVEQGDWDNLLRKQPVKAGQFYYVPHGTIHAIGAGILILETQQSSDTTYRVYDYDRRDQEGNLRDLHLSQSADVTMFPHQDPVLNIEEDCQPGGGVTHFLSNEYFSVYKWQVEDEISLDLANNYQLATVIAGQGSLIIGDSVYPVHKGDSFIIAYSVQEAILKGQMEIIATIAVGTK